MLFAVAAIRATPKKIAEAVFTIVYLLSMVAFAFSTVARFRFGFTFGGAGGVGGVLSSADQCEEYPRI